MHSETGLEKIRRGQPLTVKEQILLVASLSMPAILSQLTTVVMQYIDAAMVGKVFLSEDFVNRYLQTV